MWAVSNDSKYDNFNKSLHDAEYLAIDVAKHVAVDDSKYIAEHIAVDKPEHNSNNKPEHIAQYFREHDFDFHTKYHHSNNSDDLTVNLSEHHPEHHTGLLRPCRPMRGRGPALCAGWLREHRAS